MKHSFKNGYELDQPEMYFWCSIHSSVIQKLLGFICSSPLPHLPEDLVIRFQQ